MSPSSTVTVLVTGAGGSAAANYLDALRRSGDRFLVVGADASAVRLHLSSADERILLPPASDPGYADALRWAVKRWGVDVIHAQPEAEVLALGRVRDEVEAATFLPHQNALEAAADKAAFAQAMQSEGVEVPDSADFADWSSVTDVVDDLLSRHERVWIRARRGAGARASLPVRSSMQAAAWLHWWHAEHGLGPSDFMAAEMLPGREFAYQSLWREGELIAGQARERVEYLYGHLTPHGQTSTPAVARTVRETAVDALAMAAIRALDPHPNGVYCVDIKEAADGRAKVTEINAGRFFTTCNFFAAAGLNMPEMQVRCALGERVDAAPHTSPLAADQYWVRMVDMGYALVPGNRLAAWPSVVEGDADDDRAADREGGGQP